MYLLIGANGFLGSYVLKNIIEQTSDKIVATVRITENLYSSERIIWKSCDVTDFSSVDLLSEYVKNISDGNLKVVYLAAYHNPDLVEKNPRVAWNVNVTSLSYFLNKLENVSCLFYPSTDSVYGESVDGYHFKETDHLNPVNTYGKQKVVAEQIVRGYGYNVVRYPFLISPSLSPGKKHFYDRIVEKLSSEQEIEMFSDSYRSTFSFDSAARFLVQLMENYSASLPKTLNICGDKALSKYDVGLMVAQKIGACQELVKPVKVASANGIFEAKRASSTLMDNSKFKEIFSLKEIKLEL